VPCIHKKVRTHMYIWPCSPWPSGLEIWTGPSMAWLEPRDWSCLGCHSGTWHGTVMTRSNGRPSSSPMKINYCVAVICIHVLLIIILMKTMNNCWKWWNISALDENKLFLAWQAMGWHDMKKSPCLTGRTTWKPAHGSCLGLKTKSPRGTTTRSALAICVMARHDTGPGQPGLLDIYTQMLQTC